MKSGKKLKLFLSNLLQGSSLGLLSEVPEVWVPPWRPPCPGLDTVSPLVGGGVSIGHMEAFSLVTWWRPSHWSHDGGLLIGHMMEAFSLVTWREEEWPLVTPQPTPSSWGYLSSRAFVKQKIVCVCYCYALPSWNTAKVLWYHHTWRRCKDPKSPFIIKLTKIIKANPVQMTLLWF